MKRKLFTVCALVSLLMCAATVWWWTGSGARVDQLTFERNGAETIRVWGNGGKFMLSRTAYPAGARTHAGQLSWASQPVSADSAVAKSGLAWTSFSYARQQTADTSGGIESTLVLPAWLLALAFSVLPMLWIATKLKRRRKPAGG